MEPILGERPQLLLQVNFDLKQILFQSVTLTIDDALWEEAFNSDAVVPFWHNEKDKIIWFNFFTNGYYYVEKMKLVKDFKTNEYVWHSYDWNEASFDAANDFYKVWRKVFLKQREIKQNEYIIKEKVALINPTKYTWNYVRLIRSELLRDSDWVFLGDSSVSEEEKYLWLKYRDKLRNLTSDYNIETDFPQDVVFPHNPTTYKRHLNTEIEYLEDSSHFYEIKSLIGDYNKLLLNWVERRNYIYPELVAIERMGIPTPDSTQQFYTENGELDVDAYEKYASEKAHEELEKLLEELQPLQQVLENN